MKTMAAVATAPETPLTITEVEVGGPAPGELQVRMVASGVCHTDAIVRDQWYPTPLPAVLGHEGAGIVEAFGQGVSGFEAGDRVLLSFSSCGTCRRCLSGELSYCEDMFDRNFGGRRTDGSTSYSLDGQQVSSHFFGQSSFAALANVPVRCAVKVDRDAPLEILAPLGCGIQTGAGAILNVLDPEPGSAVAVFGAGAVGLSAVMAAKVAHCSVVIAVDRNAERLELARELGATHTVLVDGGSPAEEIRKITGQGVQYALETTGVPAVFTGMIESLAPRGTAGVVGAAALGTSATFDIGSSLPMGLTIKMIVEGESIPSVFIPRLMELHRAGLFPFDRLVKTYPFGQINEAFEDSAKGTTLKPVVVFP
ncbi:NAD(P)-dependent alcohol dehydrogenase [Arthrobacter sp. GCM10027362]|uniref:NAD(P)-dependent alcohol dehydrogenase n=1 Tax=Arthrobacter sp. GCM10027362 TaxID=3273379 RepID=UPI0036355804